MYKNYIEVMGYDIKIMFFFDSTRFVQNKLQTKCSVELINDKEKKLSNLHLKSYINPLRLILFNIYFSNISDLIYLIANKKKDIFIFTV